MVHFFWFITFSLGAHCVELFLWKICKRIFNLYLHGHHLFADRHLSDVWVLRFAQFSEKIIRFFIIITINLLYITFFSWDNEPSKYWLQNKFRNNKSSLPHQKRQLFHFYYTQSANCPNTSPLIYIVSFKPSFTLPRMWNPIQSLLWWTLIISRRSRISRRNNYCKGFWNNLRRYLITFPDAGIFAEFSGKASLLKVCECKITLLIARHVFRYFIVVDVLSTWSQVKIRRGAYHWNGLCIE